MSRSVIATLFGLGVARRQQEMAAAQGADEAGGHGDSNASSWCDL